ncbi:hypothetical protein [Nostoc sp.]
MTDKANFLLRDTRPDDRIHLLLWDTPEESELVPQGGIQNSKFKIQN